MRSVKLALVVLVHNQATNLRRLIPAYLALTAQPDLFVFVCDRCTDDSMAILDSGWTTVPVCIVTNEHESAFRAGRNRDIGAETAEDTLGPCNLVFLDGDCIPSPDLLQAYVEIFEAAGDYPVVAVGRRINENSDGTSAQEDNRLRFPGTAGCVFEAGQHKLVVTRDPTHSRLATWSCNLGLNVRAIELQRAVNFRIDRMATIFNDGFTGRWGGEDDFVGSVAAHAGMALVGADPNQCYVRHIHHVSRENSEYVYTVRRRTGQLKHLATRLRMPGVCFARTNVGLNVNEAARAASTSAPSPVFTYALAQLGFTERAGVYWQAHAAHTAVTGPLVARTHVRVDLGSFRAGLEQLSTTSLDALAALPQLKYTYELPTEAPCNICGSTRGYEADGRCCGCMSMPWNRMAAALTRGRTGLVTNPELAGEKIAFAGWESTNYHVDKIDLVALPYNNSSFDTVVSTHVLEHIRDDSAAVSEIARVLRPGGFAILAFPTKPGNTIEDVTDGPTQQARRLRFYWHDHFRVYGLSDVQMRLQAAGLEATPVFADELGVPGCAADDVVFKCVHDKYQVPDPARLYLDVFNSCNYACTSCNIHSGSDRGGLDVEMYKIALREFADLGGRQVHFQSGEIWLRKSVASELAQAARALGLEAHLITNGSVIKPEDTSLLSDFACVTISIDSHVPCEHDTARGILGAYNAALHAQSVASRVTKTVATQVLTQSRVASFPAYVKAMLQTGFDAVGFNVVEPDFAAGLLNGTPFYDENKITDIDGLGRMLDMCLAQFGSRLAFTKRDIAHVISKLSGDPGCGASASTILISRDMNIRLCAHKPPIGKFAPGALAKVWTGAGARIRRDQDQSCARPCATGNCNRT